MSMLCPHCQDRQKGVTRVTDSGRHARGWSDIGELRRRRRCTNPDCGARFNTIEVPLDTFKALHRAHREQSARKDSE